jgi:hypothetical protein
MRKRDMATRVLTSDLLECMGYVLFFILSFCAILTVVSLSTIMESMFHVFELAYRRELKINNTMLRALKTD